MRKFILFTSLCAGLVAIGFTSCTKSVATANCTSLTQVKWATDVVTANNVQTIINNNCVNCHGAGGTSPDLSTYAKVAANASSVSSDVASGKMPKSGSLTSDQSSRIQCWVTAGALNN